MAVLGDSAPRYEDSIVGMRHRYLRVQLGSMAARARMLDGERLSFDEEARALGLTLDAIHAWVPTATSRTTRARRPGAVTRR